MVSVISDSTGTGASYLQASSAITQAKAQASTGTTATQAPQALNNQVGADPSELDQLVADMTAAQTAAQGIVSTSSVTKDATLKNDLALLQDKAGSQFSDLITSMNTAQTAAKGVASTSSVTKDTTLKNDLALLKDKAGSHFDDLISSMNAAQTAAALVQKTKDPGAKANYQSQLSSAVSNIKSILFGSTSTSSATIGGSVVSLNETNGTLSVATPQTVTNAKTGVQSTLNVTKAITGANLNTYKQNQNYQSQLSSAVSNIKSILFGNTSTSSATISGNVVSLNETNGTVSVTSSQTVTNAKTGVQSTLNVTKAITGANLNTYKQNQDYKTQLATQVSNIKSLLFDSSSSNNDFLIGDDASQGSIGDCYLITGLNGVGFSNDASLKSTLANRVSVNETNGSINVTFQHAVQDKKTGAVSNQNVTTVVDASGLKAIESKNYYAHNAEAFTNVLERGYSQFRVTTHQTNQSVMLGDSGGNTSTFLNSLTGKATYLQGIYNQSLSSLDTNLQQIVNSNGRYIVAADTKSVTSSGVVSSHAYLVKGYDSSSQTVKLVNPWNSNQDVNMSLLTFQQNFQCFDGIDTAA